MAINKKLIHFKNFSDFNSKKLSANENNTQYTLGVDGEVQTGSPDILYQSICWIKDVKKIWTHGQYYNCSSVDLSEYLTANEIAEIYATTESLNEKQDALVSGTNIKTINGESILGSGAINVAQSTSTGSYVIARGIWYDYDVIEMDSRGITFIPEGSSDNTPDAPQQWRIYNNGDGTKFLSDDGTYKEVGGGNSNANVQAVDTGDVIDDVTVEYTTKAYVDGLVGDINSILESIISGEGGVSLITFTVSGTEYQAEEGMTWGEWCNSEYNTSEYYYDSYSNTIKMGNAHILNISVDDLIINDASYTLYDPT